MVPRDRIESPIRAARTARGWSQEQCAVHAGMCTSTFRAAELGRYVTASTLAKLAAALGVAVEDLK